MFSLEDRVSTGCYDFMEIFDGNSSTSPSFGRFCGTAKPADKRTTHHEMLIRFHSGQSAVSSGFSASYLSACDRNFTALTSNLRSPNLPSGYMNNQDCSFLITVPPDYSISLTFQHFNLQPNSPSGCLDYVEMFDGGSSGAPSLGRLCGPKEPTEDKRTTQNEMLVHFHTDSPLALSGFDASYHSDCDRVFTTLTGSFHSPGFPSTYSNNQDCDFLISVPRGYRIALTFLNFGLEAGSSLSGCHDFVEVLDGSSKREPSLGRHCGTQAPSDDIQTTQHEMLVRFHTDSTDISDGFNASYISDCHMTFTAPSGSFYYPDYPPNYGNDQDCDYLISVAPGHQITVKFHHIGQEPSGTIDDDCSSHVEIFDGNSTMAPSLGHYCGTGQPEVNHTTGNQMLVRFHSDGSVPSPRFYSTYSSVNASLTSPPDSSANSASDVSQNAVIVGGSVGGFALVLAVALIILIVLFVKRTDRKEAEPLALSEIHGRPTSNAYLSDTKRETEQEEEDIYENTAVEINDENPEGVYSEPAPSCPPQTKTTGQRRLRDNRSGAAQISKPAQEDVLPYQPAVQEPQFPCEGDYEGLCRTQADADVNDYVMPPQPDSREPAKYPEEDLYMNM
ncbi:tolloid-like protein 1 [Littorina saxatilis]|uniref:CUB domain-containing protein n=1 Tax=Littorina saxatilis TaxID=31220 RepID=A0AAN9AWL1_9CAEN